MEFTLRPIGRIHTPFTEKQETPIQSSRSHAVGCVQVDPEFADGLQDLEGFSHIILLYLFHLSSGYELLVKPFLDDVPHGLFATRYPRRPNPIGLSIVTLLARDGCELKIGGADMLDGTPLIDVKPYVPEFDHREVARIGWYASRRWQ
jgi:tRNA (adenine37-N6)-methyltransferase